MKQQNIQALVPLFGTTAEIARIAQVDKAAVVRWRQNRDRAIHPVYQERILRAAAERGFDFNTVARALGVPRCPACGTYHILPH